MSAAASGSVRSVELADAGASGQGGGIEGALPMLTTYVVLLLAIPSQRSIAAFGSLGRPAILWGLVCLGWWAWSILVRTEAPSRRVQPVRIALGIFVTCVLISYVTANLSSLAMDEISPADTGLVRAASWAGVVLLANDGLGGTEEVRSFLRRLVTLSAVFAVLGLAQFVTGDPLVNRIQIPGLMDDPSWSVAVRGDFTRASATASHPLEYASVLSACLPLSIAVGITDRRHVIRRWWPSLALSLAALVSVSRSAIIGVAVGVLVLLPALSKAYRRALMLAGLGVIVLGYAVVPGLIGTIRGMFLSIGGESSTQSRSNAASIALDIAANYGPFGRGFGTFLPRYLVLDNQILMVYIELGIVGLLAFLGLVATAVVTAILTARALRPSEIAVIPQGCAAAAAAVCALMFLFDGLGFTMAAGMLFLSIGLIGATRNVLEPRGKTTSSAAEVETGGTQ